MYKCLECGEVFQEHEAEERQVCYEDYYGVADLFHGRHYMTVLACPFCGTIEEMKYIEEEENEEKEI